MPKSENQAYLESFRNEKNKLREDRTSFVIHKITFISTLFGLSAIKFEEFRIKEILYFIPLVAIFFDLYIGETNLAIRLRGLFIRRCSRLYPKEIGEIESEWENKLIVNHRSMLTPITHFLFTLTATGCSLIYLAVLDKQNLIWKCIIFGIYLLISTILYRYYQNEGEKMDKSDMNELTKKDVEIALDEAASSKSDD